MSPLAYDDSAFNYFACTSVLLCGVPLALSVLGELTGKRKARHQDEKDKLAAMNKMGGWLVAKIALVVLLFALAVYYGKLVLKTGFVAKFDPYEILELDRDSNLSFIKKQYRRLSLIYHPDKNIGPRSQTASEMFQKIAKAYEALTDETSKENYRLYGNPDGKQAMEISIGLPKFLLKYPKLVMVAYLLCIVLFLPLAVWFWYRNSTKFGAFGVLRETFNKWEVGNISIRDEISALKTVCNSKETDELVKSEQVFSHFKDIVTKAKLDDSLGSELGKVDELAARGPADKKDFLLDKDKDSGQYKVSLDKIALQCLLAFIYKTKLSREDKAVKTVSSKMAVQCRKLMPGLYEKALQTYRPGQQPISAMVSVLRASQCLAQANGLRQDPLWQLPGMTNAAAEAIRAVYPDKKAGFRSFLEDVAGSKDSKLNGIFALLGLKNEDGSIKRFQNLIISGFPLLNVTVSTVPVSAAGSQPSSSSSSSAAVTDDTSVDATSSRSSIKRVKGGEPFFVEVSLTLKYNNESTYCPAFFDEVFNSCHLFLTVTPPNAPVAGDNDDFRDRPDMFAIVNDVKITTDKVLHSDFVLDDNNKKVKVSKKMQHMFAENDLGAKQMWLWLVNDSVRGLDMLLPLDIEVEAKAVAVDGVGSDAHAGHSHSTNRHSVWDEVEDDAPSIFSMMNTQNMINVQDADYSTDEDEEDNEDDNEDEDADSADNHDDHDDHDHAH